MWTRTNGLIVVLKTTLHNLAHCHLFCFPRDFEKLKINSEVCVRDGEEYIPTHCHETQLKKTGITSLEHIDTPQTVRAIKKKKKRKGKERKKNRIECNVGSWNHSSKDWMDIFQKYSLMIKGWEHIVTKVSFNLKIVWIYIITRKQATWGWRTRENTGLNLWSTGTQISTYWVLPKFKVLLKVL